MQQLLGYDSETSNLPLFSEPSGSPEQPHIVQLAAVLVNEESRNETARMSFMVRPNGWHFADEAIATHGITEEQAMDEGIDELECLEEFMMFFKKSTLRIGHNVSFDNRIVRIAQFHCWENVAHGNKDVDWANPEHEELVESWYKAESYCTMKNSKQIVKCPPTAKMRATPRFRYSYKAPKLEEAYQYFFNEPLVGAHDAMVDVEACMRVYWALQDLKDE